MHSSIPHFFKKQVNILKKIRDNISFGSNLAKHRAVLKNILYHLVFVCVKKFKKFREAPETSEEVRQ